MPTEPIASLLARWEAARAEGRDLSAAEVCHDCPEEAGRVAPLLEALRRLAATQEAGEGCALAPCPSPGPAGGPPAGGGGRIVWASRALVVLGAVAAAALLAGAVALARVTREAQARAEAERERAEGAEGRREAEERGAARARGEAEDWRRRAEDWQQRAEDRWIDGWLRPIGQTAGALSHLEVEALKWVATQPSDRLRLRFVERGLDDPAVADGLGRRAEWVVQAVVGLDERRRGQLCAALAGRLRARNCPPWKASPCVQLGVALGCPEPAFRQAGDGPPDGEAHDLPRPREGKAQPHGWYLLRMFRGATSWRSLVGAWDRFRDLGPPGAFSREERGDQFVADLVFTTLSTAGDREDLAKLEAGLRSLASRMSTEELMTLLRRPSAAGPGRRVLLSALELRARRPFRTVWSFREWAASNGVTFPDPG